MQILLLFYVSMSSSNAQRQKVTYCKKNHAAVMYLLYTGCHERRPLYTRVPAVESDLAGSYQCSFLHSGTLGHPRILRTLFQTSWQHTANYMSKVLDKRR